MTALDERPQQRQVMFTDTAVVVTTAPDGTPEWHAARREGMGGSDIGIALGLANSKYASPLKLWLEKRGELPDLPESEELSEYGEAGRHFQDPIADLWASRSGYTWTAAPGTLAHVEAPWMRVNLDGIASDPAGVRGVLEVKNRSEYQLGDWEDGVPLAPALQAHWGMAITGFPYAVVAALVGGNKLRWHRIERDIDLESNLVTLVGDFWRSVLDGRRPEMDASEATTELLGQLYGVTIDKVVVADRAVVEPLLDEQERLKAQIKDLERELRGVENQLRDTAKDGEVVIGDGEDRSPIFTYRANGTFASKKFTEAHPKLALRYTTLPSLDRKQLAMEEPELYARFRARVLRRPAERKTK